MNFTGQQTKLTEEKKEHIKEMFSNFYTKYADFALDGQVEFMDSVYEQFKTKEYLSSRQIEAVTNILNSCEVASNDEYDTGWGQS